MVDPELRLMLERLERKVDKLLKISEPEPKTLSDASIEELVTMLDTAEPDYTYNGVFGGYTRQSLENEVNRRSSNL